MTRTSPLGQRARAWFIALATFATRRPRVAIVAVAVAAALSGGLAWFGPLEISTSRRSLLSSDDPGQARLLDFFERFGRPDAAIFVISGGAPADRQAVARELIARLPQIPELTDRVMGRLDLRLLAEVLALQRPALLDALGPLASVAADGEAPPGLPRLAAALERQILDGLDGLDDGGGGVDDLARLAPIIRALDARLRGDDVPPGWLDLGDDDTLGAAHRLDPRGYLTTGADHHVVAAFPELDSDEGRVVSPLVDAIRAVRDDALAAASRPGVTADLTGMPALATDELRIVGRGIQLTSVLSTLGLLLLLFIAFRSLRQTVIALIPLGAGVVITLGAIELLYDGLNLITSSFVPVLMGLGIDLAVHILYRYGEEQRVHAGSGEPAGERDLVAMSRALVHAGPGVATGAATTALAFVAVATTEFTAFAELGVITSIGLLAMLGCAFLLIPPLMRLGRNGSVLVAPEFPGGAAAEAVVVGRPRVVIGVAVVVTALAVASLLPTGPGYNGRYFDFLPSETESARALDVLEADGAMGPAVVNVVARSLDEARELASRLRAAPEVGEVHAPTDLLPPLDEARRAALTAGVAGLGADPLAALASPAEPTTPTALARAAIALGDAFDELAFALEQAGRDPAPARELTAALSALRATLDDLDAGGAARLEAVEDDVLDVTRRLVVTAAAVVARGDYAAEDLPPVFRHRYISRDGELFALHAFPAESIWDEAFARRFVTAVEDISPTASGLALDIVRHQDLIVAGFLKAAGWAALIIIAFLSLVFRSVRLALVTMLPLVVGWLWMLGAMKPLGLRFDVANLVALPLLLGIGVDAAAHIMHRFRESAAEHGVARVSELVRGTGAAVLVSSLTTMVGFGALMAGGYGAMESLGLLLVIGIAASFLASTLLLPALLVLSGRAR